MKAAIKPTFTAFVVILIVLPLPPSTIIGLAIVAHPKTNKHLDHRITLPVISGVKRAKRKILSLYK